MHSGTELAREVASFLNFFGDLLRDIVGPMPKHVERDYPNRRIELPGHQIGDHGLKVGSLDIGLAVGGA
jgi:hypothetical protein